MVYWPGTARKTLLVDSIRINIASPGKDRRLVFLMLT